MTDPATTLYYALSTLAQCAAALAALIGFFGLWRLDRHKQEREQVEQDLRGLFVMIGTSSDVAFLMPRDEALRLAQQYGAGDEPLNSGYEGVRPLNSRYAGLRPKFAEGRKRWDAIAGEQWWLMLMLSGFLFVTLVVILAPAIVGIVHVEWLKTWAWTPTLLYVASALLAIAPTCVVLLAARSARALVALALLLGLTSPTLAWSAPPIAGPPASCTTTYNPLLARWETVCSDGTRAITSHDQLLNRDETTIMSGPRRECTGRLNSLTQQLEVRCR